MTHTLNITFEATENERFPVYCKYSGQFMAQPAYIYLDLETGDCGVDYNGNLGNATPAPIWHDRVLTFSVNPETHSARLAELIKENKENFQAILDGSEIVWDGNNNVGRLNDAAAAIYERLNDYGNGFCCDQQGGMVDDLGEWLNGDIFPKEDQSIDEFAAELYGFDGDNGYFFSDELNSADSILSHLRDLWADHLYSGDDLPKAVAQHLLDEGTCDDSEWLDELKEFANVN